VLAFPGECCQPSVFQAPGLQREIAVRMVDERRPRSNTAAGALRERVARVVRVLVVVDDEALARELERVRFPICRS
jgi:hypothetical protein